MKKIARQFRRETFILCFIMLIAGTVLVASPSMAAQAPITVPLGDVITLKGVAPGSDSVYLFLTGPNLPSNGVKLDNIRSPVVTWNPSTFTKVDVVNDRWSYKWYTKTSGGVLDAGSYTVYAVTQPVGRSDLQYTDYTTIPVSLTTDVIATGSGTIIVNVSPAGAEVYFEGKLVGYSPVKIVDLPPGDYTITLKKEGYRDAQEKVSLKAGGEAEITRALEGSGSIATQTTTATATSSLPPVTPLPTTTKASWPVIALIFSLVAIGVLQSSRRKS